MIEYIFSSLVGVLCIVLGISNMKGNISSLHFYHRHRVKEKDKRPFGKMVGLGTVIIGCCVIINSALSAVSVYTENPLFLTVGTVILITGLVVGLGISFYAMIKYNKGIF